MELQSVRVTAVISDIVLHEDELIHRTSSSWYGSHDHSFSPVSEIISHQEGHNGEKICMKSIEELLARLQILLTSENSSTEINPMNVVIMGDFSNHSLYGLYS